MRGRDAAGHRWFCGALGHADPAEYERLRQLVGAPVDAVHSTEGAILHARATPEHSVRDGVKRWHWKFHGPSFTVGPGEASLSTDESGVVPVFLYRADGYALFSSSLDALARCTHRRLHTDWAAWSEILSCLAVVGQRTPFEEIRRLPPSTIVRWSGGRLTISEQAWPWAEDTAQPRADEDAAAAEIIETVTDAVRSVADHRVIIPLSGGWDSRFLATVAARHQMSPHAVTVPTESGKDQELEWAQAVAHTLGIEHTLLGRIGWEASFARTAAQVEFLTSMHFWLLPLPDWLATQDGIVIDGLGGHLIKGTFVPSAVFDGIERPYAPIAGALSARLPPDQLLATPLAEAARSHVDGVFRDEWTRWREHPAAATLCVYRLRSLGGTVLSPMLLLASSAPVFIPFVQPSAARAAISVPTKQKVGGRLYRKVLDRLGPDLARIPSPHDTEPAQTHVPAPLRSPAAIGEAARLLGHPALAPLIGTTLRGKLAEDRLRDLIVTREGRRVVHGLALLSLWLERYETRLADVGDLPWAPRTARTTHRFEWRQAVPRSAKSGLRTAVGAMRRKPPR